MGPPATRKGVGSRDLCVCDEMPSRGHLMQHGARSVVMGEREIARTMLEHARERCALFEPDKAG